MTQTYDYGASDAQSSGSEPKKNRTLVIVLIVIAVLLLCCCLILAGGWFFGDQVLEFLSDQGFDLGLTVFSSI
jgi:flagellar basal body-associated protein FliL